MVGATPKSAASSSSSSFSSEPWSSPRTSTPTSVERNVFDLLPEAGFSLSHCRFDLVGPGHAWAAKRHLAISRGSVQSGSQSSRAAWVIRTAISRRLRIHSVRASQCAGRDQMVRAAGRQLRCRLAAVDIRASARAISRAEYASTPGRPSTARTVSVATCLPPAKTRRLVRVVAGRERGRKCGVTLLRTGMVVSATILSAARTRSLIESAASAGSHPAERPAALDNAVGGTHRAAGDLSCSCTSQPARAPKKRDTPALLAAAERPAPVAHAERNCPAPATVRCQPTAMRCLRAAPSTTRPSRRPGSRRQRARQKYREQRSRLSSGIPASSPAIGEAGHVGRHVPIARR